MNTIHNSLQIPCAELSSAEAFDQTLTSLQNLEIIIKNLTNTLENKLNSVSSKVILL